MPYNMKVDYLKQALRQINADPERVEHATFNSMRRFLPTAFNVFNFPEDIAQAIGSWEEVPRGDGRSGGRACRPMSLHYSDEQALASGRAKIKVLKAFVKASSSCSKVENILQGRPAVLEQGDLPWSALAAAWAQRKDRKRKHPP